MGILAFFLLAPFLLALVACGEPLEFAPWTVPVPEAATVHEYAPVTDEERGERTIQLVAEVRVGDDEDAAPSFYQPRGVVVDERGRAWVLDGGNHRILVFDRDGALVRSIARQGEGPGELQFPFQIGIASGRGVVYDSGNDRLSFWDLDGIHRGDVPVEASLTSLTGLGDGSLVVTYNEGVEDERHGVVAHWSVEAEELRRYARAPGPLVDIIRLGAATIAISHGGPSASVAVDAERRVYVTVGAEYQVHVFEPGGGTIWALRVAQPAAPWPADRVDAMLENIRRSFPDISRSDLHPPEWLPVVDSLAVDGHGHVYVFPYRMRDELEEAGRRPADVYDADGERLFAGWIATEWRAAHGDRIWLLEEDEREEQQLVAYRLVEPF